MSLFIYPISLSSPFEPFQTNFAQNVNNWCDVGNLSAQVINSNSSNSSAPHVRRDFSWLEPIMIPEAFA